MQTTRVVLLTLLFALAATGAWAQACPPATTAPAAPAAVPAPEVSQPSMTGSGPSCAAQAGLGAGPMPALQAASGPDFDRAYIENMYRLHTGITALATQGIEQTEDKNLKDLSGKIRYEQTTQNEKLSMWYRDMGMGRIKVDYMRVGSVVDCLTNVTGPQFDTVYANTMTDALRMVRDSAQYAITRLSRDEIRKQAEVTAKAADNEIVALQRWVSKSSPAAPGVMYPPAPK